MMKRQKSRLLLSRNRTHTKLNQSDTYDSKPNLYNYQQAYEKYLGFARESLTSGDRIVAENYFQHAEHYLRLVHEWRELHQETPPEIVEKRLNEMTDVVQIDPFNCEIDVPTDTLNQNSVPTKSKRKSSGKKVA